MQHRDCWRASGNRGEGPGRRIIHLHQPSFPPPPCSAPVPGTESDNEASTDHHYQDHHHPDHHYHGARELELERDHYTVHSQYFHPERQRRSDWGSRDAQLRSFRDLPPFAAYHELTSSHREEGAVWSSASGDNTERYFQLPSTSIPHRVDPTPKNDHSHFFPTYPPPPPLPRPHYHSTASHLYPHSSFYSSSSSTSLPSSSHEAAPHIMHHLADTVSAVDLIKSSREKVEGYMHPTAERKEEEWAGEQRGGSLSSIHADTCSVDRPSWVDRGDPVPYMEGMGVGPEEWSRDRGVGVVPYDVAGQVECVQEEKQKERRKEEEREEEREEEGEMEEWKDTGQERDKEWAGEAEVGEEERGEEERGGGSEEAVTVSGYENSFVGEVWKFVQRQADLFNIITETNTPLQLEPTLHNLKSEAKCEQIMCPYHMS